MVSVFLCFQVVRGSGRFWAMRDEPGLLKSITGLILSSAFWVGVVALGVWLALKLR